MRPRFVCAVFADDTEVKALFQHTSDILECQWKKCTRSYRTRVKLDRHCVHHAQKVLHCPYEGTVSHPVTSHLIV